MDWLSLFLGVGALVPLFVFGVGQGIDLFVKSRQRVGMYGLLWAESQVNQTRMLILRRELDTARSTLHDNPKALVDFFLPVPPLLQWERIRWDQPDVAGALKLIDLARYTRWYEQLGQLTYLCTRISQTVTILDPRLPRKACEYALVEAKEVQELIEGMVAPPEPGPKSPLSRGIRQYTTELVASTKAV